MATQLRGTNVTTAIVLPDEECFIFGGGEEEAADQQVSVVPCTKRRIWFHVEEILVHAVEKQSNGSKVAETWELKKALFCFVGPSVCTRRCDTRSASGEEGDWQRWREADNDQNLRKIEDTISSRLSIDS